jgi:hypothetical protein
VQPLKFRLPLVLALLWLIAVPIAYYALHKPFTAALTRSLGGALVDLASVFLLVGMAGGLGRRLLPQMPELSRAERIGSQALVGLGALSVLIFVVGLLNLSFFSMVLLLLAVAAFSRRALLSWLLESLDSIRSVTTRIFWGRWLALFIGSTLVMACLMALTPPTTFDTLTYQLTGPKLSLEAGHFRAISGSHFFGFPQLVNTLYAGQMALLFGRMSGAAALHGAFGVLTLITIAGYGARRFKPWIGLLAAAIFLTAPTIWLAFSWAYVDLATAAYGFLAFVFLDEWRGQRENRWLILTGVALGLGMSVKYNFALVCVAVGIVVILYSQPRSTFLKNGAILVCAAVLTLAPWLLRNLVFFDNPIYPFGPASYEWDSLTNEWYNDAEAAPLRQRPAFIVPILLTPTLLGVHGGEDIFNGTIGPLFLLLIPLLLLSWRSIDSEWRRSLGVLLLLAALMHIFWFITAGLSRYGGQMRFMFPLFTWLAVLAAASLDSLEKLPRKPIYLAWMVRMVVLVVMAFTLLDYVTGNGRITEDGLLEGTTLQKHFLSGRSLDYLAGILDEDAYLNERLGWHMEAMREINALPEGSRVLFLWETRSLYCDEERVTCIEDTVLYNWWYARRTSDDILETWREEGITHVLVWNDGRKLEFENNRFFTDEDKTAWGEMEANLELIAGGDIYSLYVLPAQTTR